MHRTSLRYSLPVVDHCHVDVKIDKSPATVLKDYLTPRPMGTAVPSSPPMNAAIQPVDPAVTGMIYSSRAGRMEIVLSCIPRVTHPSVKLATEWARADLAALVKAAE
jgi:hypothetical protein